MSAANANNIDLAENLQVAIISGGRPKLKQRATARLLAPLKNAGIKNIAWVVSEKDAPQYEHGEYPIETYSTEWAYNYAATHWMKPTKPTPGDFLGAFPGREWACRLAQKNHCRYLLQLDDNIQRLSIGSRDTAAGAETAKKLNGLVFYAQTLTNITAATNTRMCGAQLTAVAGNKKNHPSPHRLPLLPIHRTNRQATRTLVRTIRRRHNPRLPIRDKSRRSNRDPSPTIELSERIKS